MWIKAVFFSADQVSYKKLIYSHLHWRQQAWSMQPFKKKKSGHCSAVCINVCHNIWALLNPHRLLRDKRLCILLSSPSSHALLYYFAVMFRPLKLSCTAETKNLPWPLLAKGIQQPLLPCKLLPGLNNLFPYSTIHQCKSTWASAEQDIPPEQGQVWEPCSTFLIRSLFIILPDTPALCVFPGRGGMVDGLWDIRHTWSGSLNSLFKETLFSSADILSSDCC